jgi:hypothetical protein
MSAKIQLNLKFQQINQPDATVSQVCYLTFMYGSICFGRPHAHHQERNNCSSSLWFYRWSVVVAALLVVVGSAGPTTTNNATEGSSHTPSSSKWPLSLRPLRFMCIYVVLFRYVQAFRRADPQPKLMNGMREHKKWEGDLGQHLPLAPYNIKIL